MSARTIIFAAIAAAYPLLAYAGLQVLPPLAVALAVIAVSLLRVGSAGAKVAQLVLVPLVAAAGTGMALLLSADLAVRAYPILVNAALAALFGWSLLRPPTIVERFARLAEPDLPAHALPYVRKVTWTWLIFFLLNGAVAAWTAVWGTLEQWTFYNGFLAYVLIGLLFAGEWLVRRRVRARAEARP